MISALRKCYCTESTLTCAAVKCVVLKTRYLTYTLSAVLGATYLVKRVGSKRAATTGMWLFCWYVACFLLAAVQPKSAAVLAYSGAAVGGIGAGIGWTAQGVYFTETVEAYSLQSGASWSESSSRLSAIFAFTILTCDTSMDVLATVMIRNLHVHWTVVFALYSLIAVLSTLGMFFTKEYPTDDDLESTMFEKSTAAVRLLVNDSKMKYMISFNVTFGLAGAFLNSFVSGEVVPVALSDNSSSYVGFLVAIHGVVAALASLFFGIITQTAIGKVPVLIAGSLSFALVALPFLHRPAPQDWTFRQLILAYAMEGVGRSTSEGTLKALFADYFPSEKEGAFANIILQYGLASAAAYWVSNQFRCTSAGKFCVAYRDGSKHNVFAFALILIISSVLSAFCLARAFCLRRRENSFSEPPSYG
jgi:MFS family permease